MANYVVTRGAEGMLRDCTMSQPGESITDVMMTTNPHEALILQADAAVGLAGTFIPQGFDFMPEEIARDVFG